MLAPLKILNKLGARGESNIGPGLDWIVVLSDGTAYQLDVTVRTSDGTAYTVVDSVKDSAGTSYVPI